MTPAVTSECAHIHSEHRCWRRGDNVPFYGENWFQHLSPHNDLLCLLKSSVKWICVSFQTRPGLIVSACWSRTSSRNGHVAPSLAASAFGSDQDYQIDIISELDLANATYGITQVAGLHNNSKAFLFRGNARMHAWRLLPQKFWTVFVSRLHARGRTRFFVSLVIAIKGANATPLWYDRDAEADHHGESPLLITPHLICPRQQMLRLFGTHWSAAWCSPSMFHFTNVTAPAADQISAYL